MVRKKLGLYFGANAQLTIHPFMAPRLLQQLVVLNRHPGEVSHHLGMTAMDLGPGQSA